MTAQIEIAMLPAEALEREADCYVAVDLLRATTTIATLFGAGLASLLAVNEIGMARERARSEDRLLFGEVDGFPPKGFDYGNSPVEARLAPVAGRGGVLFTTNGTAALCALAGRGTVVAGAVANVSAVARFASKFERVTIVCAGNHGGRAFSLEDFAAAAVIARALKVWSPGAKLGDAAWLGIDGVERLALDRALSSSRHAKGLTAMGLGADVEFCTRADTSVAVPMVVGCGDGWALIENGQA